MAFTSEEKHEINGKIEALGEIQHKKFIIKNVFAKDAAGKIVLDFLIF